MRSFIIICFNILIFGYSSYSQKISFNGYVFEQQTGEPILNALLHVDSSSKSYYSNSFGYFNFHSKKKVEKIICSAYGYQTDTIKISFQKDTTINIYLKSLTSLAEVVVKGQRNYLKEPVMGLEMIPQEQVKDIPAIGSETDVIKTYQLLPGVVAGNEGTSGLLVRGGSADQTLFVIDGVPLYYINHLGGFISTFNNDIINNVRFYKGSFPARFGGRLSSVFDVSMKNGNIKKFTGDLSFGIVASRFYIEGPIVKNKLSMLFSFRTMPVGWLLAPISKIGLEDVAVYYTFFDLNQKFTYIFNKKNRFFLNFYKGNDIFHIKYAPDDEKERFLSVQKWGNEFVSFRWNHIYNVSLFSNMNLYYTRFNNLFYFKSYHNSHSLSNYKYINNVNVGDLGLKYSLDYSINNFYKIKTGAALIFHVFNTQIKRYDSASVQIDATSPNEKINAFENTIYLENIFDFGFISLNLGARESSYFVKNVSYPIIQPRLSLSLNIIEDLFLKLAYSYNIQYVHHLSTLNEVDMPADYWLPSTSFIKPEKNRQLAAGLYENIGKFQLSVESYYKKYSDLIETKEGRTLFAIDYTNWQKNIEVAGTGYSYGVELLLKKTNGIFSGWIAYTYSRSFRLFKNINQGHVYPYRYDRPNSFNIVTIYKLNKKITFSAVWVYGTGYPYTKPKAFAQLIDNVDYQQFSYYLIWEPRNSSRMSNYHRLDLSMIYTKKNNKNEKVWSINIYNVYSRLNPYYYDINAYYNRNKTYSWKIYKYVLFPIIPSISYTIKF